MEGEPAGGGNRQWKLSVRTGERVNATEVCRAMGGGGHAKAAGGRAHGTLEEAKRQVLDAVQEAKALS